MSSTHAYPEYLPIVVPRSHEYGLVSGSSSRNPSVTSIIHLVKGAWGFGILSTVLRAMRNNPRRSCVTVTLVIFVPLGMVSYLIGMNHILVFVANLLAVIPLSSLLTYATDQIARESSDVVGALLNVTFGNLVEILIL
jgi:hypothetical protein